MTNKKPPANIPQFKIQELAIDVPWAIGVLQVGMGSTAVLSINHPRHGFVHVAFGAEALGNMRDWLNENFPADRVTQ